MMQINEYLGWPVRRLNMPDGGQIICLFCKTGKEPDLSVYDGNHNVYRLDKEGKVIWQVTRIELPGTNWELKHKMAREEGQPGCIEPFIDFRLYYADGSNSFVNGQMPLDVMDWVPGCKVEMANLGFGTRWFTLDVDTGVAVDITTPGLKAW